MNKLAGMGYSVTVSLWVGGMFIFTFLLTPIIFNSFDRDEAARVVGALFEGYFYYVLILSLLALVLGHYMERDRSLRGHWLKMALITAAVVVNLFVSFILYPEIQEVKSRVKSFVTEPEDSKDRMEFGRLHGISAILNILVLADGTALLVLDSRDRAQT